MFRYVTSAEAARILGLTPSAIRTMARTGRLVPVIRKGTGLQLFDADQVKELVERRAAVLAAALKAHPAA